jgi:hypothetical protein
MDMKHDFRPDPDIGRSDGKGGHLAFQTWMPEMFAIVGIFVTVWIGFGLHFLAGGLS